MPGFKSWKKEADLPFHRDELQKFLHSIDPSCQVRIQNPRRKQTVFLK